MNKYPPELKELVVRFVLAARDEDGGHRGASTRIGQQLGIPSDTLRGWVHTARRPTVAFALADRRATRSTSPSWSGRFASCGERTRSCGRPRSACPCACPPPRRSETDRSWCTSLRSFFRMGSVGRASRQDVDETGSKRSSSYEVMPARPTLQHCPRQTDQSKNRPLAGPSVKLGVMP